MRRDHPISFCARAARWAPLANADVGEAQFEFRILKGHTAEQLLKHRNASVLVFVGFAVMGLATIAAGEEMIRDSVEVVEVL